MAENGKDVPEAQNTILSAKIAELEKIPESITKINKRFEGFGDTETLQEKFDKIEQKYTAEIEKLKPSGDVKERAKVENLIDGKLKELKGKVFLWDKLKILALILTLVATFATVFVLKMDARNIADAVRADLSAALSILAALFVLCYLILSFSNAKILENYAIDIKELEKLKLDFTKPGMTVEQARAQYQKIMRL
jgi:hypothetical protein